MITHIVMWKFKDDEVENKKKFLNDLRSLYGVIDVIRFMDVKESVNPNNKYDAVLVSKFDNLDDLNSYKNDPRHLAVSALCKEIRIDRAAIDFED